MKRKRVKVKAYCPYEIGDMVQFEKGGTVKRMEITDVITETSARDSTSKFRLELDGWYMLDTNLHDIAVMKEQE